MKLTLDERIKHRLVGLGVIVSIAAILLPAILKKSNQPFDAMSRVAIRLPAPPHVSDVKVADEARLFKTMKVAKVSIPDVSESSFEEEQQPLVEPAVLSQAKPSALPVLPELPKAINTAKAKSIEHEAPVKQVIAKKVRVISMPTPAVTKPGYAVQVANFSSMKNAQTLMSKLQQKGYPVYIKKTLTGKGQANYRVLVGRAVKREEIIRLQKQLLSQMRLQGFVVAANVG